MCLMYFVWFATRLCVGVSVSQLLLVLWCVRARVMYFLVIALSYVVCGCLQYSLHGTMPFMNCVCNCVLSCFWNHWKYSGREIIYLCGQRHPTMLNSSIVFIVWICRKRDPQHFLSKHICRQTALKHKKTKHLLSTYNDNGCFDVANFACPPSFMIDPKADFISLETWLVEVAVYVSLPLFQLSVVRYNEDPHHRCADGNVYDSPPKQYGRDF